MDLPATIRCPALQMTMTEAGCVRLWRSAQENEPKPWEGRSHCRGCPAGAARAGCSASDHAAQVASDHLRRICPGCTRGGQRMIGGERCVSCYNRRREVAAGRNKKGGKPRLKLADLTLGTATAPAAFPRVSGYTEALLMGAKAAKGRPVSFGRPALALPSL